jgi:hypothetical protein
MIELLSIVVCWILAVTFIWFSDLWLGEDE